MAKKKIDPATEKDSKYKLPEYPAGDDIYNREKEESLEEDSTGKVSTGKQKQPEPLDMGLDVPGADGDDRNEIVGEEDEENNYYSIGGDRHENLEEDKDE